MNEAEIQEMWELYDSLKEAGHDLRNNEARKMMDKSLAYLSECILAENGQDKTLAQVDEDMKYADEMRAVIEGLPPVQPQPKKPSSPEKGGRKR